MDAGKGFAKGLGIGAIIGVIILGLGFLGEVWECTCVMCNEQLALSSECAPSEGCSSMFGFIFSWSYVPVFIGITLVCGIIGAIYGYCIERQENMIKKSPLSSGKEYSDVFETQVLIYKTKVYDRYIKLKEKENTLFEFNAGKSFLKKTTKLPFQTDFKEVNLSSLLFNDEVFFTKIKDLTEMSVYIEKKELELYEEIVKNTNQSYITVSEWKDYKNKK